MFGFSIKGMLAWIGGLLVASVLTILGAIYVVDHYIHPPNMDDPLARQGGLKPEQEPKLNK